MPGSGSASSVERAEELYVEALADGAERVAALDALVVAHPELERELRALHAEWSWLDGFRDPSRSAPPLEALGDEVLALIEAPDSAERYERRSVLARGGMGVIHRVWDARLGRELAMKVSNAARGTAGEGRATRRLLRFLDEAHVMGRLQHPGIVPVHDIGIDEGGRGFFTMRLVEGEDLRAVIRRVHAGEDGWDMRRVLRELVSTCDTVAYAHSRGVLHRDLKPSNVMVGPFGESYVMDWGLAKVAGRDDDALAAAGASGSVHTLAGAVLGTPAYMPPEQAAGDELDERADVYGIGAMLYHLLTGERPYAEYASSGSAELLAAVLRELPRPVRQLAPDAPLELVAVCERAMARDKVARYEGPQALGADLLAFLETRVVHAYRHGPLTAISKWVQRNRATATAIGAAVVLALGAALVVAGQQAGKARALEEAGRAKDARAYAADLFAAQAAIAIGRTDTAREHLERCPEHLRGWEWRHVRSGVDRSTAVIPIPGEPTLEVLAASPDGRHVAVTTFVGSVYGFDPATNSVEPWIEGLDSIVESAAFAPDGAELVVGLSDGRVLRYSLTNPRRRLAERDAGNPVRQLTFMPNGRLLVCSYGPLLAEWDAATLADIREFDPLRGMGMAHLDPAGTRLVTTNSVNTVRILDYESGDELARAQPLPTWQHSVHPWEAHFTPDGTRVLGAALDGALRCFDAETLEQLWVAGGHTAHVWNSALSPSGALIATGSRDHSVRVWDVRTGRSVFVGVGHEHYVRDVVWLAEDELLTASHDGTLRRWNIGRCSGIDVLPLRTQAVHAAHFSPDGVRLCTSGRWEPTYVVDVASGGVLARLWGARTGSFDNEWDPTGRFLAVGFEDESVRVWDARDYVRLVVLPVARVPSDLVFARDGERLFAVDRSGTVHVWRTADWSLEAQLDEPALGWASLTLDPSGARLVCHDAEGDLHVWDVADWSHAPGPRLPRPAIGSRLDFSPDGELLAVASADGSITLLETSGWQQRGVLRGHTLEVMDVDFSPDGTRLASGSRDLTVRVWHVAHKLPVATFTSHTGWVWSTRFSPDGETLVSAAGDKRVVLRETRASTRSLAAVDWARERVEPELEDLFDELGTYAAVRARIDGMVDRPAAELHALGDLAHWHRSNADELTAEALALVEDPHGTPDAFARGLARAREALRFRPDAPEVQRAYGVALLRNGRPAEAARYLIGGLRDVRADDGLGRRVLRQVLEFAGGLGE